MDETTERLQLRFYPVRGSKQIERIAYDPETGTLYVKFYGASLYLYTKVPGEAVAAVMFAASVGSAFNDTIKKGGYAYEKLDLDHEAWRALDQEVAGE